MEAYKLDVHPIDKSRYNSLSEEELFLFIQNRVFHHFIKLNPEGKILILASTNDSVPFELLGEDHDKLGIAILNILEEFEVYISIPPHQEDSLFPKMETFLAFLLHNISENL
ncbi:hypothetical protein bcgnr5390_16730 [Bacillus luti]|nr:hypothetical protein BC2903_53990 [Bacillus cereus]